MNAIAGAYVGALLLWSAAVATAMGFLLHYRKLPFIRIRRIQFLCTALGLLHLQLVWAFLAYPLEGKVSCPAKFWVESFIMPIGMAAFHLNNWILVRRVNGQTQLLQEQRAAQGSSSPSSSTSSASSSASTKSKTNDIPIFWWLNLKTWGVAKLCSIFILSFIAEFLILMVVFAVTSSIDKTPKSTDCYQKEYWIPFILWQAFWIYGVGLIVLYNTNLVHDTHRWRFQVNIPTCISFAGFPLWLFTVWCPIFDRLKVVWPAELWYAVCIISMQAIMLCFPLMEVYYCFRLKRKARLEPGHPKFAKYSIGALDRGLGFDFSRLEEFTTLRDLTGENLVFLKQVEAWKQDWAVPWGYRFDNEEYNESKKKLVLDGAKEIWRTSIDKCSARCPITVDDEVYNILGRRFGHDSSHLYRVPWWRRLLGVKGTRCHDAEDRRDIPDISITPQLFDKAEQRVRIEVVENTWVRYVETLSEEEMYRLGIGADVIYFHPREFRPRGWSWKKLKSYT